MLDKQREIKYQRCPKCKHAASRYGRTCLYCKGPLPKYLPPPTKAQLKELRLLCDNTIVVLEERIKEVQDIKHNLSRGSKPIIHIIELTAKDVLQILIRANRANVKVDYKFKTKE